MNPLKFGLLGLPLIAIIVIFVLWRLNEDITPPPVVTPPVVTEPVVDATTTNRVVIGQSVNGQEIVAHSYGEGETVLLFVGGIHGGYEWNSSLLAYRMIKSFENQEILLPADVRIVIIPDLNPDGTSLITGLSGEFAETDIRSAKFAGEGRFNQNKVDLNRNFACKWQATSSWRGQSVSAGTAPFSEPEAAALRDYVLETKPSAVIFWHSQANAVYASECEDGILASTTVLMNTYATAAGYPAVDTFDAYPVTGDAEGWLASIGIPAITVELSSHTSLDWDKNRLGVEAVIKRFSRE